jgi:uncharacterized membrane protein
MNSTTNSTTPLKSTQDQSRGLLVAAGIFLGMGFAGFFDGIVLHQVLQWHHMLTSIRPPTSLANLEINTLWDGFFHIGAFALTAVGLVLLWRAGQRQPISESPQTFVGSLLIGAGSFNLIEGIVDHHLLGIHHVKPGPHQLGWDLGFLAIGAALAILGWLLLRQQQQTLNR